MKRHIFAAALATGLAVQSAPTAAWYQWYYQDMPVGPIPGLWNYQNVPYQVPGTNPFLGQTPPWLQFYRPDLFRWWTMPSMSSGISVEQDQSPLGYHIRVYVPGGHSDNLRIGLESGAIVISSSEQAAAHRPLQMGWSSQWVTLPADANLAAMKMSRGEAGVEIFVPRLR